MAEPTMFTYTRTDPYYGMAIDAATLQGSAVAYTNQYADQPYGNLTNLFDYQQYGNYLEERIRKIEAQMEPIAKFLEEAAEQQSWEMINDFLNAFKNQNT